MAFAAKKTERTPRNRSRRPEAPKVCRFTIDETFEIDYRDMDILGRYVTSQGKIQPRKRTGACAFYQRQVKIAVKRARYLALLPYLGQ
jgi:small subunit ribosomal protein S18